MIDDDDAADAAAMRVAGVLFGAADTIEARGWWDGKGLGGGRPCAGLAVCWFRPPEGGWTPWKQAIEVFAAHVGVEPNLRAVYAWNDAQPSGASVCRDLRAAAVAHLGTLVRPLAAAVGS